MIIDQGSISDGLSCCNTSPSNLWCALEPTKVLEKPPATIELFQPVLMLIHRIKLDLREDVLCTVVRVSATSATGYFALCRFILSHVLSWGIGIVFVKK